MDRAYAELPALLGVTHMFGAIRSVR
jgi:hypothetical protein